MVGLFEKLDECLELGMVQKMLAIGMRMIILCLAVCSIFEPKGF